ncbi:DUF4148 domain-containing protein [Caballeronia sp. 15715]|uniref:DUF4148 domain-containing protein n=1 Tax=Caballeronia sp. 15715 TaxID=3391030 RepID=UPI0039E22BEB
MVSDGRRRLTVKNSLAAAIATILICSSSGLVFAEDVPNTALSNSGSDGQMSSTQTSGKTRAQVRAEMKATKPTSAQHDRDVAQSVTGIPAVSRKQTSP